MKITWKVINGCGPYAYLQDSISNGKGSSSSRHLKYLGRNLTPGGSIEIDGQMVQVPDIPDGIRVKLNPTALKNCPDNPDELKGSSTSDAPKLTYIVSLTDDELQQFQDAYMLAVEHNTTQPIAQVAVTLRRAERASDRSDEEKDKRYDAILAESERLSGIIGASQAEKARKAAEDRANAPPVLTPGERAKGKSTRQVINDIMNDPKEKKPRQATPAQLERVRRAVPNWTDDDIEAYANMSTIYDKVTPENFTYKWDMTQSILASRHGDERAAEIRDKTQDYYGSWKMASGTPEAAVLRWAAAELDDGGEHALEQIRRYDDFLQSSPDNKPLRGMFAENVERMIATDGADVVEGLRVVREQNQATFAIRGEEDVVLWRGWRDDQVENMGFDEAQPGDVVKLSDPPVLSWSLDRERSEEEFTKSPGDVLTRTVIPVDKIVISDITNSTDNIAEDDNEVLFKGVKDFSMEVVKVVS